MTWDCQIGRKDILRVCCELWALLVNLRKENILGSLGSAHSAACESQNPSMAGLGRDTRLIQSNLAAQGGSQEQVTQHCVHHPWDCGFWLSPGKETPHPSGQPVPVHGHLTGKFFLPFRRNFLHSSFFPLPLILLHHPAEPGGSTGGFFFPSTSLSIFYRLIGKKPKSPKCWNTVWVASLEILYYIDECISVSGSSCTSQFWPSILHTKVWKLIEMQIIA